MTNHQNSRSPQSLPEFFRPIFWSFRFDTLNTDQHKKTIVVQTVNYGSWKHWQWLAETYGKPEVARLISEIPATEFRAAALTLARLIFDSKEQHHAYRSSH